MSLELQLLVLLALLVLSAFFSGVETALVSVSRVRLRSLLKQKKPGAEALDRLKKDPHKMIVTILIGNNLVNIGAASFATVVFTDLFGSNGLGVATGVMTFLVLVFGEITPKTFATQHSEGISLRVARPIELLSIILTPFVIVFEFISRNILRLFGSPEEKRLSEDDIKAAVSLGEEHGVLSPEAAEIMQNVHEFDEMKVTTIMTPRLKAEFLDGSKKLKDVLDFVVRSPYSRYPVYFKDEDKIVGILDVDDVLRYVKDKKIDVEVRKMVRPAFFVPESMEIDELLFDFEEQGMPMAVVVDEYGYVSGIVTVDDVMEEIVGEIFDKSKRESVYIKKVSDRLAVVDAKVSVEEVNRVLQLGLKEKQFKTIAGFIQNRMKKIPVKGEQLKFKKFTIEIDDATRQGIKSVKIIKN